MEWQALLIDGYGRVLEVLEEALGGMSPQELDRQPHPDCNSVGWLAWHLTRIQDDHISALMGKEQLWTEGGWHARFSRPASAGDLGFGHSPEDVAAFKSPDARTFLEYHRAVLDRTRNYIRSLTAADLDRELDEPWYQPPPTVGVRLISVLADNRQAAYVRGFLQGKGWLGY